MTKTEYDTKNGVIAVILPDYMVQKPLEVNQKRNLEGFGVQYTLSENSSTFCLRSDTLQETEIKGKGLINLEKKIPRKLNIQTEMGTASSFSRFTVTIKYKSKTENLKNLNLNLEGTMFLRANEILLVKKLAPSKINHCNTNGK